MNRPLLYLSLVLFSAVFWAIELLGNYADYTTGSPIFLTPHFMELFQTNRIKLVTVELLIPAGFFLTFLVLIIMKFRAQSIRYSTLLILFLATGFWYGRTFIFPDRMLRYFQMSDPAFYADVPKNDPFLWYLIAHGLVFGLVMLVREYSEEFEKEERDTVRKRE